MLLATLPVRVDAVAERITTESALEVGTRLIVSNMLTMQPMPLTCMIAREYASLAHEEDLDEVRASDARGRAGDQDRLLRISSVRPLVALLELARKHNAGLLVFGRDRSRLGSRRFRSAARTVRRDSPDLVWPEPAYPYQ